MRSNNNEANNSEANNLPINKALPFFKPLIPMTIAQLFVGPLLVYKDAAQSGKTGSLIEILRNIHKEDGVRGLYRGTLANYIKTLPSTFVVVHLTGFNIEKTTPIIDNAFLTIPLCASISAAVETGMSVPAEAFERYGQTGVKTSLKELSTQYTKLFRPMMARNFVSTSGTFFARELQKNIEEKIGRKLNTWELAAFYTASSLTTVAATAPFDALVRRAYVLPNPQSLTGLWRGHIRKFGLCGAITAGMLGRILSVGPQILANQASVAWVDRSKQSSNNIEQIRE